MRLDSHQHFWRYSADQYPWIQADWPIGRDFLPNDLAPLLTAGRLDGTIAVQARQNLDENHSLLELADRHAEIRGVVGWVDLRSERLDEQLAEFARREKFVGVRHVVQDEPDDEFVLGDAFVRGISRLKAYSLTYDLLIFPRQLLASIQLVERFPDQPFVLDHLAKPLIRQGELSPWREQIQQLAKRPNVMCKVSGMVTEARWDNWQPADFRPYLDVVAEAFGAERLMYGSDWPVCTLAGSYAQVLQLAEDYFAPWSEPERTAIFGGNAARFYLRGSSRTT